MSDKNLGLGVMIKMLSGSNKETVELLEKSINRKIIEIELQEKKLILTFEDEIKIAFVDDGQSCCERRYMTTDDDLKYYVGAKFLDVEIKDADTEQTTEYGDPHEIQFLKISTSKGWFTIENHNEHNGYYGGFWIAIEEIK